ncbi:MAG TPA: uridine kinase [Candidatus Wallbacteria bacterium]|nr:MAG: Uridine kinase [bacterium ADurb.Bin243]HOD39366.1 uridine kinase [Candidatus Wallbacteria bacterium]HPG57394.1 uridine kinase [Candidatus Wallbacteria bacterium]
MKPFVLGIAGGSGSGKTTVTRKIISELDSDSIILLDHDSYYKDQSALPFEKRTGVNYDHPDALDNDLLLEHLKLLREYSPIEKPVYNFVSYTRSPETLRIEAKDIIILEGFLIFADPRIRQMCDIKIYVDTDDDVRIIRRIERDLKERGRSLESIISQYFATVKPMHHQFVEPSKRFADVIIPYGGHNQIAIDMVLTQIKSKLKDRQ